jgi:XTP/dITP diphosphohydrolase
VTTTLLLATSNPGKLREARPLLARAGFDIIGLADLPARPPEPDEPFDSFIDNALHKARHYARLARLPCIAEDSGIRVDALGGAPGVHSKRFSLDAGGAGASAGAGAGAEGGSDDGAVDGATILTGEALDRANNRRLLELLDGTGDVDRGAHYVCAAAFNDPAAPAPILAVGTCAGRILHAPRGSNGFGYDPLFLLPDLGRTFAELPLAEKNLRSHRARALRALAGQLPRRPGR